MIDLTLTDTKNYIFFLKNWMSNFHGATFQEGNVIFRNTEQYFMYHKALTFGDKEAMEGVLAATTPWEAKRWGRAVKNYDENIWASKRYSVMYNGNLLKYCQNPKLALQLLGTGSKILVECNPNDAIWGIAMSIEEAKGVSPDNWKGKNLLGLVLMDVREYLRTCFDGEDLNV